MPNERFYAVVGSGEGSQIEYDIIVENGKVYLQTQNTSFAYMRNGPGEETKEVSLDDLKSSRVRGGKFYEAAKIEVERQLELMRRTDKDKSGAAS